MSDIETFFEHHGVKGMHWGVRKGNTPRIRSKQDKTRTHYQKPPIRLTEAELKRRVSRMQVEKQYNDLNTKDLSEGKDMSKKILKNVGNNVITTAATTLITGALIFGAKQALTKKFGEGTVTKMYPKKK